MLAAGNDTQRPETKEVMNSMMYYNFSRPVRPEMMHRMNRINHMMRAMCEQPHPCGPRPPMAFPVDVKKTDDAYVLTAALPGVKLDAIAITVENDVLTIAADLPRIPREELACYIIHERAHRPHRVERSFRLEGIDQAAITADAADGILTVILPKEAPAEGKGPRRIAIGGSVPAIEGSAE